MAVRDHFRAHARRRINLGAVLKGPDGAPFQSVKIRDLGLGGIGIELALGLGGAASAGANGSGSSSATEDEGGAVSAGKLPAWVLGLDRDAQVTVELTAPTLWDPLVVRGTIAWIKRGTQGRATRAGVRFEHREPAALFTLFQLLGAHADDT